MPVGSDLGTLSVSFVAKVQEFLKDLRQVRDTLREINQLQKGEQAGTQQTIRIRGMVQLKDSIDKLTAAFRLMAAAMGVSELEAGKVDKIMRKLGEAMKAAEKKTADAGKTAKKAASEYRHVFDELGKVFAMIDRVHKKHGVVGTAGWITGEDLRRLDQAGKKTKELGRGYQTLQEQVLGLGGRDGRGGAFGGMFSGYIEGVKRILFFQLRWYASYNLIFGAIRTLRSGLQTFLEFQDVMAQVRAIAATTAEETSRLAEAAREMGRTTIVSATDAAKGLQLLAQAGFTAGESIDAIQAVTKLAVGGVSTMDESVKLLTTALRAFRLSAAQADEVANVLVATVNQSKTDIDGLNVTFNFAANSAAAAGLAIQDLAAIVGVMADNGVRASTQGTAVRQVIAALINPTERAVRVFNRLGISLAEINPLSNDIVTIFKTLRAAGFGASEAFEAFERRTGAAAVTLVRNAEAIETMRNRITGTNDATRAFEDRQKSLSSQIAIATNNFKELAISIGEDLTPAIRTLIGLWNALAKSIDTVKTSLYALLGTTVLLAGARGLGGLFGRLREGLQFSIWLQALSAEVGASLIKWEKLVGLWWRLAGVIVRFARFGVVFLVLKELFDWFVRINEPAERVHKNLSEMRDSAVRLGDTMSKTVDRLRGAVDVLSTAAEGSVQYNGALKDIDRNLADLIITFPHLEGEFRSLTDEVKSGALSLEEYSQAIRTLAVEGPLKQAIATMTAQLAELEKRRDTAIHDTAAYFLSLRGLASGFTFAGPRGEIPSPIALAKEYQALQEELEKTIDVYNRLFIEGDVRLKELQERLSTIRDVLREEGALGAVRPLRDMLKRAAKDAAELSGIMGETAEGDKKVVVIAKEFIKLFHEKKLSVDSLEKAFKNLGEELDKTTLARIGQLVSLVEQGRTAILDFAGGTNTMAEAIATMRRETEELIEKTDKEARVVNAQMKALRQTFAEGGTPEEAQQASRLAGLREKSLQEEEDFQKEKQQIIKQGGADSEDELKKIAETGSKQRRELAKATLDRLEQYEEIYTKRIAAIRHSLNLELEKEDNRSLSKTLADRYQAQEKLDEVEAKAAIQDIKFREGRAQAIEEEYNQELELARKRVSDPETLNLIEARLARERDMALERLENEKVVQTDIEKLRERSSEKIAQLEQEAHIESIRNSKGRIAAVEEEYQLKKAFIQQTITDPELRTLELKRIELEKTNELRKIENALVTERLTLAKNLYEEEQRRIKFEADQQQKLLDLKEEELKAGKFAMGQAQGMEWIERERLRLHLEANQQTIALARERIASETRILAQGGEAAEQAAEQIRAEQELVRETEAENEVLAKQIELIQRAGEVTINLGELLEQSLGKAFEGIILGISKLNEVFRNLGNALLSSISQALAKSLIEKAGFDQAFKGNFFELGGFIRQVLGTNIIGGMQEGLQQASGSTSMFGRITGGLGRWLGGAFGLGQAQTLTAGFTAQTVGGQTGWLQTPTGAVVTPGSYVPATTTGTSVPATQGLGTIGGLASAVTALIGLAMTLKNFVGWLGDSTRAATGGQSGPRGRLQAFGGINMGIGIAGGAAAGAIAGAPFLGVGAIPGAILGAAIGAAISQAVNKAITSALTGALNKTFKQGLTQQEFEKEVYGDTGINILRGVLTGAPVGAGAAGLGLGAGQGLFGGGALNLLFSGTTGLGGLGLGLMAAFDAILAAFMPDIEVLFETEFTKLWKRVGMNWNRQLKEFMGQGLGPAARGRVQEFFKLDDELRERAESTTLLITALIGAGVENEERMGRFFNILANNIARFADSAEEADKIINRMVRYLTSGSVTRGMRLIQQTFGWMGDERVGRQFENMLKAYEGLRFFEGLDLGIVFDIERQTGALAGRTKRVGRKEARDVALEATGGLLTADTYEEGLESFYNAFRSSAKNALVDGFKEAMVIQGPIGLIMTEFFGRIGILMRKGMKRGFTDARLADLEVAATGALERAGQVFEAMESWLPQMWQMINDMLEGIDDALKTAMDRYKDTISEAELFQQVEQALSGAVFNVMNAMRALTDTGVRLAQKIYTTSGGEGLLEGGGAKYQALAGQQQVGFQANIAGAFSPEIQLQALGQIENTVDQWLDLATREIKESFAPALEIANQAAQLLENVTGILHQLRISDLSSRPAAERLDDIRADIKEQKMIMMSGEPEEQLEAAGKLQQLVQDLLNLGQSELDTSGPLFRELYEEAVGQLSAAEGLLETMGDVEGIEEQMNKKLADINDAARVYYQWLEDTAIPLLEEDLGLQQTTLASILTWLQDELDVDGGFKDIMSYLRGEGDKNVFERIITAVSGISLTGAPPPGETGVGGGAGDLSFLPSRESLITRARSAVRGQFSTTDIEFDPRTVGGWINSVIQRMFSGKGGDDNDLVEAFIDTAQNAVTSWITRFSGDTMDYYTIAGLVERLKFFWENNAPAGIGVLKNSWKKLRNEIFNSIDVLRPLATGGIIQSATAALLGESGAEAVIPLSRDSLRMFAGALTEQMALSTNHFGQMVSSSLASYSAGAGGGTAGPAQIVLNVEQGAFQATLHNADTTVVQGLPEKMMEQFEKSIRYGRLGAAIERRMK